MKDKFILWLLKRKARKLWKKYNEQFYIVPVTNWKYKWMITNERGNDIYNFEARKLGKPRISRSALIKMAVYMTKPPCPERFI